MAKLAIYYFYFDLLISTWLAIAGGELEPQTCLLYKCGGSRLEQPCACDDLCLMYGDCCGDHPFIQALNVSEQSSAQPDTEQTATGPSTNTETTSAGDRGAPMRGKDRTPLTVPHPRIHCVNTHVGGTYLLVDQCLPDWHSTGEMNDAYVREMCETRHPGVLQEYLIPVIESATGLSYRNLFCGVCNGGGEMAMWGYAVHCEKSWSQNLSESERFHEVLKKASGKCKLRFTEAGRRECVSYVRSECLGDGNHKHAERCRLYLDPVKLYHSTYKNLDCVMCSVNIIKGISCTKLSMYGYESSFRMLSLSELARLESIQHSSRIQSNQIMRKIEEDVECNGVFYLLQCRRLYCRQGYSMKNGICVIDMRYNYVVNLHPGSQTASWSWQSQHINPIINQYRGGLSNIGEDCWKSNVVCREVYYQSAENLSQTTEKLLSVLYGAYQTFKLTTDVYGKGQITSNCTNKTKNSEEPKSDISAISQMLDMISASFQWPAYINFSMALDGMNTVAESSMEACTLQSHTCPLVVIDRTDIEKTHAEIREGFKKYSNILSESGKGLCADVVRTFLKAQRDWRNKELVVFVENIRRINEKNDAIGIELAKVVVCLGVIAVVLTTAM